MHVARQNLGGSDPVVGCYRVSKEEYKECIEGVMQMCSPDLMMLSFKHIPSFSTLQLLIGEQHSMHQAPCITLHG